MKALLPLHKVRLPPGLPRAPAPTSGAAARRAAPSCRGPSRSCCSSPRALTPPPPPPLWLQVRYVNLYHQQLSYCVTQFVEKDPKLAIQVIESILAFWPMTYSPKEVLFLNEAEEILEMIQVPPAAAAASSARPAANLRSPRSPRRPRPAARAPARRGLHELARARCAGERVREDHVAPL